MYSKAEIQQTKQKFWTAYGKYMQPVPDAAGNSTNWINYDTSVKEIKYNADCDNKMATCQITITSTDVHKRLALYKTFVSLKSSFDEVMGNGWEWHETEIDESNQAFSIIYNDLSGVNIMKEENWPTIITFFKNNIINFDKFWESNKDIFQQVK